MAANRVLDAVSNATPPLSATDTSPVACGTGFCHLGGPPISNRNAYGPGWRMWPTPDAAQSAPDWLWRTRSTMLSRARGEKGLVK
jgi:hypothetical protein